MSNRIWNHLQWLGVLLMLMMTATAQAGSTAGIFVLIENDPSTKLDDQAKAINLKWYDDDMRFWYRHLANGGPILLPSLNRPPEGNDIQDYEIFQAFDAALDTWNSAGIGFSFADSIIASEYAPDYDELGRPGVYAIEVDGFNVISFIDDEITVDVGADIASMTIYNFFTEDFEIERMILEDGFPPNVAGGLVSNLEGEEPVAITLDVNNDNRVDITLPIRDFEAGEMFDVDIYFNPEVTSSLHVWPQDRDDVPSEDETNVRGSLDIQAMLTHELGSAMGLGDSKIYDSVMYPYFNGATFPFPHDPYERRELQFDDIMTAKILNEVDFDSSTGTIAGNIYSGLVVAGGSVTLIQENNEGDTAITDNGPYIQQVPVYLGIVDETVISHPDVVDSEEGPIRFIAQVLSGQNIILPNADSLVPTYEIGNLEDDNEGNLGQDPVEPELTEVFQDLNQVNSIYLFPGLEPTDEEGIPINYAIYVEPNGEVPLNWVHANAGYPLEFDAEFYGGPGATLDLGGGQELVSLSSSDEYFQNGFITAQINLQGRVAAGINSGPGLLSGYGQFPKSYIEVTSSNGTFSNEEGSIGVRSPAISIDDQAKEAEGAWVRSRDFRLQLAVKITEQGGQNGIPSGLRITYSITNLNQDESRSFKLKQILDTFLFGREGQIFAESNNIIPNSTTFKGELIPTEIVYQTSEEDPVFRGVVTLRGQTLNTPDAVTLGKLSELSSHIAPGTGAELTGLSALNIDTGMALEWESDLLLPNESQSFSFIVGFLPVGELEDTYVPFPLDDNGDPDLDNESLTGAEDNPQVIRFVNVEAGGLTQNIDIYTNDGELAEGETIIVNNPVGDGGSTGNISFERLSDGFPELFTSVLQAASGDIDNDGDLDVVTANFAGATDGRINRIYLNEQRIEKSGDITYYYRDVTYGEDQIASTSDDRFQKIINNGDGEFQGPANYDIDETRGVCLADFDGDGDLDIFFANSATTPNRFFMNMGPDPEKIGFFIEASEEWLPGLMNLGWDTSELSYDNSFRCTAGDIDSDGDMDLIISLFTPYPNYITTQTVEDYGVYGFADIHPAPLDGPDGLPNGQEDLFGLLRVSERVLINQTNQPNYSPYAQGNYFREETLGSDDEFGTLSSLTYGEDELGRLSYISWDPTEIDRMPAVLPNMANDNSEHTDVDSVVNSPQSWNAIEPKLGSFFDGSNLDLFSIRAPRDSSTDFFPTPFTDEPPEDAPEGQDFQNQDTVRVYPKDGQPVGSDPAYMRNVDLFSVVLENPDDEYLGYDAIADGYFVMNNYGMDYSGGSLIAPSLLPEGQPFRTAGGLFAWRLDLLLYQRVEVDIFPLFVSFPDGHPADYPYVSPTEFDVMSPPFKGGWGGDLADYDGTGYARPLLGTSIDNIDGSNVLPFVVEPIHGSPASLVGSGYKRLSQGILGGEATAYQPVGNNPYEFNQLAIAWTAKSLPAATGLTYGVTSADFDMDGDIDVFFANWTLEGYLNPLGGVVVGDTPALNQLFENDSFSNFTDVSNRLVPNSGSYSRYALAIDYDNDGDSDLLVFNDQSSHEVYINEAYMAPPDLTSEDDSTAFYEGTISVLPPYRGISFNSPFQPPDLTFNGVTVSTAVADFNLDGRPDLAYADGGRLSQYGGTNKVFFNSGITIGGGVRTFRPLTASYPAPATFYLPGVDVDETPLIGTLDPIGPNVAVLPGDVDNDGDADIIILRGNGQLNPIENNPALYLNLDSSETFGVEQYYNTVPDPDTLGDGIFTDAYAQMPDLSAIPENTGIAVLKQAARDGKTADFNGDGYLDFVQINGYFDSGAPNVMVYNQGAGSPGFFSDVTEYVLPLLDSPETDVMGIPDNTYAVVVGDFDHDGDVDVIFANETGVGAADSFRMLMNNGSGFFTDADPRTEAEDLLLTDEERDEGRAFPTFSNRVPRGMAVGDFDQLGEETEDTNYNGYLDVGEDTNGNSVIDWVDLPTETEDLNGNGVLDPGEDGLIELNGEIDTDDLNGDKILTARRPGVWEGSLDVYISFDGESDAILINDPTGKNPGTFVDESSTRLPVDETNSRGIAIGDIDLDGLPDIVVAQFVGGATRHIQLLRNTMKEQNDTVGVGFFEDISYEVPFVQGTAEFGETTGENEDSITGWAVDVDLLDYDLDGDLDIHVSTTGKVDAVTQAGDTNIFYVNRIIGDGFNYKPRDLSQVPGNPIVYNVEPRGAMRGEKLAVEVHGSGFTRETIMSFGSGVRVEELRYRSDGLMMASLHIEDGASIGPRAVAVENPTGMATASKVGTFYVLSAPLPPENAIPDRIWTLME